MDSDYENKDVMYTGISMRQRRRPRGEDFDDNNDDDSDEDIPMAIDSDSDNEFVSSSNNNNKKQKNNESHIYGVFAEDDSSDNDGTNSGRGKRSYSHARKRRRGNGAAAGVTMEQDMDINNVFVKSTKSNDEQKKKNEPAQQADKDVKTMESATATMNADNDGHMNKEPEESSIQKQKQEEKEEQEEEKQLQKQREDANRKFQELLSLGRKGKHGKQQQRDTPGLGLGGGGLGFKRTAEDASTNDTNSAFGLRSGGGLGFKSSTDTASTNPTTDTSTPSLSSFFSNQSTMSQFTAASSNKNKKQSTLPNKTIKDIEHSRDPNLGKWEKHTKGFGMKMLAKMGYKGSGGLGAKRLKKTVATTDTTTATDTTSSKEPVSSTTATTTRESTNDGDVKVEHRTGISRPVEVVVRPANLGLGFGSFKEATQLKVNKRIEAEVRGIDWKKKEEEERKKKQADEDKRRRMEFSTSAPVSLLPSTESLVKDGATKWQKGNRSGGTSNRKRHKKKKNEFQFVSYQDIVGGMKDDGQMKKDVIIDMRPANSIPIPSTTTDQADEQAEDRIVPLGEELLHNVTFLLNKYENKIHSTCHFVRSSKNKEKSLKSDLESLMERKETIQTRREKLTNVISLIDQMEAIQKKDVMFLNSQRGLEKLENIMIDLGIAFSNEEKKSLQFYTVLVPSLLEPIVHKMIKGWVVISDDNQKTQELIQRIMKLCSLCTGSDKEDIFLIQKTCFVKFILPKIVKAFETSHWDPLVHVERALRSYELLLKMAQEIKSAKLSSQSETEQENKNVMFSEISSNEVENLETIIRDEVMFNIIYPKLSRLLTSWKPATSTDSDMLYKIKFPPHAWVVPWLPHLDYKSMLTNLLPDAKRKVQNSISTLSKLHSAGTDLQFFEEAASMIKPWYGIFERNTLHQISMACLIPRLGRYLSRIKIEYKNVTEQDWRGVDLLYGFYNDGLLSQRDFLSLVEGEILSCFSCTYYELLTSKMVDIKKAAEIYICWRTHMMYQTKSSSSLLLQQDNTICRVFYGCLLMMKSFSDSKMESLDELEPSSQDFTNYRTVQARRAKEDRLKEEEEEMRGRVDSMNTALKSHVSVSGKGGATFKDVVSDFARHHDVSFHPKFGPNSTKDGKHIYVLGNIQIYLDNNVVFAFLESTWKPTSLDNLMNLM